MPQLDPTVFAPQLFWLAITFVVLLVLMWRLALPKVGAVVVMREERIQGNLKKAEQLKSEAEAILAAYQKAIADARAAAQAEHARAAAAIMATTEKREAEFTQRLNGETAAAETRIAAAKSQAMESVRGIATDLAQMMAEKLVGAKLGSQAAASAVDAAIKGRG
jgi:F-type H+-transporting ATPase subunit b